MAEPQDMVLEVLKDIRADMRRLETKVDANTAELVAHGGRFDDLGTKLDGLTHAVIAGFGSLVHEIDGLKERVSRLEREPA